MKKILITGSNGYLAKNFQNYLKDFDLYFVSRENLNLLDTFEVDNFFKKCNGPLTCDTFGLKHF